MNQWCSGSGATEVIAPVPILQGGAPLQFQVQLAYTSLKFSLPTSKVIRINSPLRNINFRKCMHRKIWTKVR